MYKSASRRSFECCKIDTGNALSVSYRFVFVYRYGNFHRFAIPDELANNVFGLEDFFSWHHVYFFHRNTVHGNQLIPLSQSCRVEIVLFVVCNVFDNPTTLCHSLVIIIKMETPCPLVDDPCEVPEGSQPHDLPLQI